MITLTRVCRAWGEIFTSRSSLWTDFDCANMEKTRVFLERSKSSPINVELKRNSGLLPDDPLRHRSVQIPDHRWNPRILQEITAHLSLPAPLLESLRIDVHSRSPPGTFPEIAATLFSGDLSLLRKLSLRCIRTQLPWRNMVNLTSFALSNTWSGGSSVRRLLDFFESAPHLLKILLRLATPTFGTRGGRMVSLAYLKRLDIIGGGSPSLLLDHLLVPVGAKFTFHGDPHVTIHLPRSFDCFRGLVTFRIHLRVREFCPSIQFGGLNWELNMVPATPPAITTGKVLESLAQFNPLKVERLTIADGDLAYCGGSAIHRVLLPMHNLRTLTISRCKNISSFVDFLKVSGLCCKLEECILDPHCGEEFDIQNVIGLAVSRRTTLKSIRIVNRDEFSQTHVSILKEYVPHVECGPTVALAIDNSDISDEDD